ncbi:MAG: exonuclease SbcCD subunit D [Lachnospiraceae bacterium]|nr:exonuclease SbcCD subunit D [Lachnospiraceae bacterium]
MKLIHLSDLHLGKRVNEFSMIEDQKYILLKILQIIDAEKPDGILIAGDVYDKSIASTEAMGLLEDFLLKIAERKIQTFIISGNHDSAERLSFGSKFIDQSGIHISRVYDGREPINPLVLKAGDQEADIYMLPFIKPASVRGAFAEKGIELGTNDYTGMMREVIDEMAVDPDRVNILIAHQFVAGSVTSDSEELTDLSIGGLDNVDPSVFAPFDYVALGHLHGPQRIGRDTIRYAGSPLKYSFSEEHQHKSVTIVEIQGKADIQIRTADLIPMHDMRTIKGKYNDLMARENYEGTATDDYIQVILTDEEDVPDAIGKLRDVYPNLMHLSYDNTRTRSNQRLDREIDVDHRTPLELFEDLYEQINNQPMNEEQRAFASSQIEKIWEEN